METDRLTHFKTLVETGNMRAAAALLGMSHPGLSKSVRALERELGVELLTREGRGVRVTSLGRQLLSSLGEVLRAEERLVATARGAQIVRRQNVHIGTFEVFSTYLSPLLARALPPGCAITFNELLPGAIEDALAQERVDYGITYIPVARPEIDYLEVTRVTMGVFGIPALLSRIRRFEQLPFVVPLATDGAPTRARGLDGWPDERHPRRVRFSVSLMETALALVREGLAVAYLPRFVVDLHNRTVTGPFHLEESPLGAPRAQPQKVYALKRKNADEDRNFKALCRVLRGLSRGS